MIATYTVLISVLYLVIGVFIFLLGFTILRTGTSSTPTRATALILFFTGLGPVLTASSIILQSTIRQDAVIHRSMVENFEYLWEFYFPSLLLFSLSYPKENRMLRAFALSGVLLYAPYVAHLITIIAGAGALRNFFAAAGDLPLGRDLSIGERSVSLSGAGNIISVALGTLVKLHKQLFLLVNVVYATTALYFISRSLRSQPNPRIARQLKTVLAGIIVSLSAYLAARIFAGAVSGNLNLALVNFSLVAGGGSVAYAVVKQQFLGIRYVTRKSLLYAAAALIFAVVYLFVVKPVSDYFGWYSGVGKEAFETGFIILAVLVFQPMLFRVEELLERVLLRGREDLQAKFKELGAEIPGAASEDDLRRHLRAGFEKILDASSATLVLVAPEGLEETAVEGRPAGTERTRRLAALLEDIGEPVVKRDLFKLAEKGRLFADSAASEGLGERERLRRRLEDAARLAGDDEVFVPILRERKCVGFVALGEKTYGLKYATEELAQLALFSNQIGVALDNIRLLRENVEKKLIEEELEIARRVQARLLPPCSPKIPGYDLSAATIPSRHVGGDYYDFDLLDDDALVLVVADVSGKGIPASLLMATLRAAVNSNADAKRAPAVMLRRINKLLFESTSSEEFATLFYGVVSLKDGMMTYANAGHEFPFLVSSGEARQLAESGMVIGCVESFPYEEFVCEIPKGGTLVLYTDGITDAESADESFGASRLKARLERDGHGGSEEVCAGILTEVQRFAEGGEALDDLTLVVLRRE
jgi:sigma-B regulation protein RsbU (phosphoserine phosphatase)